MEQQHASPLSETRGDERTKKQIAILGSTGSIGTQALQVIEEHSDLYEVYCLTANNRVELLAEQARRFKPAAFTGCRPTPEVNIWLNRPDDSSLRRWS